MSASPLKMPMPLSSSPHPSAPILNRKQSPPIDSLQLNEFSQFFKTEDNLPYPTISQHCYYLKLDIKRDWNAGLSIKESPVFSVLANEIENELKSLLTTDENFKISLVHAQKDKFSSRRILLTIVLQTTMKFTTEKLETLLREHIKKEEKIINVRSYLRDLKVRKIQHDEYEHLKTYGCNPCDTCEQILKRHRRFDVNHPSVKTDILCFLVVILTLCVTVCILLLILMK